MFVVDLVIRQVKRLLACLLAAYAYGQPESLAWKVLRADEHHDRLKKNYEVAFHIIPNLTHFGNRAEFF